MKPLEVMNDKEIALTEIAFVLAMERRPFAELLMKLGVLSATEIIVFHTAMYCGQGENVRHLLDKIYGTIEGSPQ